MKPTAFDYAAPHSLDEALSILGEQADDATVIAGGQSLVPLLALRFAQPALLIDLNPIAKLAGIATTPEGGLAIGSMTRTRVLETDALVRLRAPLLSEAAPLIGHRAIRNQGTVGGSVSHADAAAELPAAMLALGATMEARSVRGARTIHARDFFVGHYTTALEQDEILTEIRVPPAAPGTGFAFVEFARRHGDFALAGVAASVTVRDGRCAAAALSLLGVASRPLAPTRVVDAIVGSPLDAAAIDAAAASVVAELDPPADIHAGADYRRHLAGVLVQRALALAAARAGH